MGLYERLIGGALPENEPKIAVHQFMAALGEFSRGKATAQQITDAFTLSPGEVTEAAALIARVVTPLEAISIGAFVQLTNIGTNYDTVAASRGLGIARLQTAGITGFEFSVAVNKVGSGTQSWQLWNETDGAEIAVIDDAGATGVKILSIVQTLPQPLAAGFKTVRVRAKSTTASDDPQFLGACLLIQRPERLGSEELHEVLLLAETGAAYTTAAALKARLGVS
jgi:hypothetical protein